MKICESGPVICRASGQASADTLNETCPCLTCDHEAPIVAGAYCMAGNFVDRNTNQNGCGVRENASFTLNTVDRHAVAYDARHHCLGGEVSGTLQAKGEGGWSLNYILLTAIHGMIEWWQQNPAGGGQREAYTMKIRSGCDGGGKGPLVQEELSATLATHQDQTLFELRNTVLNDQDGGFMEVTHGMTGTLRAQEHGHAPITFDKTEGNEKT